jgi:carbonic anhydrase
MLKLIDGIIEFRKNTQDSYREKFKKLDLEQTPDALFICCSDSRVAPNAFASTDPGDLFVIRNVGNIIPPCQSGQSTGDVSEFAAFEFAIHTLNIKDIIVCGHAECGAIKGIMGGIENIPETHFHLKTWLKYGAASLERSRHHDLKNEELKEHNQVSQANVLQQIEHIKTYPLVRDRLAKGTIAVHAWWFDINFANVFVYSEAQKKFVLIDEKYRNTEVKK